MGRKGSLVPAVSYDTRIVEVIRVNIKRMLAEREMTISQLAKGAGLTQSYVSTMLHGKSRWNTEVLGLVAAVIGVPMWRLLYEGGDAPPKVEEPKREEKSAEQIAAERQNLELMKLALEDPIRRLNWFAKKRPEVSSLVDAILRIVDDGSLKMMPRKGRASENVSIGALEYARAAQSTPAPESYVASNCSLETAKQFLTGVVETKR